MTLAEIRAESAAATYPCEALAGCETALVLFAAAWHGKQDAIHIADSGLTGTCVDLDGPRLRGMAAAYPADWEFVEADVFRYTQFMERLRFWDVVSVDCFTNLFDRCVELLPLWTTLARRTVVLGIDDRVIDVPDGWELVERRLRSSFAGGVYWAVLTPVSETPEEATEEPRNRDRVINKVGRHSERLGDLS